MICKHLYQSLGGIISYTNRLTYRKSHLISPQVHFCQTNFKSDLYKPPMSLPFEVQKLRAYLKEKLGIEIREGIDAVQQFSVGQSNPTYLIGAKNNANFVLRKKPHGMLLEKAHMIDREYRVLSALNKNGFSCPKPYLYCSDTNVIGAEFYVMEYRQGRKFLQAHLEGLEDFERNIAYTSMVEALANLHSYDIVKLGLEDFGRTDNYISRQVYIWSKNYYAAPEVKTHPKMAELVKYLKDNIPDDKECRYTVVHGDYKFDNICFKTKGSPPIVDSIFDWELSTLGLPITDLAMFLLPLYNWEIVIHEMENCSFFVPFLQVLLNKPLGVPSESDLLSLYCARANVEQPSREEWNYYKAFTLFKLASILQGVYSRFMQGNNANEKAKDTGLLIEPLIKLGLHYSKKEQRKFNNIYDFINLSENGRSMLARVKTFLKNEVFPLEEKILAEIEQPPTKWKEIPSIERLKEKAKKEGLWNLFLPGLSGLSQMEYALIAEETGRFPLAPEVFNCNAPDTGNMEVLWKYGTAKQKSDWLAPLLEGKIRSAFAMTEPQVASSDATNMECTILPSGDDHYEINGRKWWISGAGDPNCRVYILLGTNDPNGALPLHRRHSMILVPADAPGVKKVRAMKVFGSEDAPHGHLELEFNKVLVPKSNMILGIGRGFEIAQGRLGPGRIHHCMRSIGMAERSLELACKRASSRRAFGLLLGEHGQTQEQIAKCRIEIESARLMVLKAAHLIDTVGTKAARKEIAMIKVSVPQMACRVIDRCIQIHGGAGVSQDTPLATFYAGARSLRLADGPDEVHLTAIAKMELREQAKL